MAPGLHRIPSHREVFSSFAGVCGRVAEWRDRQCQLVPADRTAGNAVRPSVAELVELFTRRRRPRREALLGMGTVGTMGTDRQRRHEC